MKRATRYISSRGWGPLNYFVLDNPVLKRTNPNARIMYPSLIRQSHVQQQSTVDVVNLEIDDGSTLQSMLDRIITSRLTNASHQNSMRQRLEESVTITSKIDRLKKVTRITSGALGSLGLYHLGSEVREIMQKRLADNKSKLREKKAKRKKKMKRSK